jgi:protein-S-isoprenylcysteine O-methyltransferase Ste14
MASSLEVKIPPPVVALVFGVTMWLASLLVASFDVPFAARLAVAVVLACIGVAFGSAAMLSFVRVRTTMDPTRPDAASSLVTGGVFRLTRNPMYLSLLLYLLAWGAYLSNWLALLLVPVFVFYINELQIKPEERALSTLFGAEYRSYAARVRRWL